MTDGADPNLDLGTWLAVCGLKREAAIWSGRAVVGGGRSDILTERLAAAIAAERPTGLISFGVCGALSDGLQVADVLVARGVTTASGETWPCDPAPLAQLTALAAARPSHMFGSDAVVADPAAKRALAARFAAVDMESHIAARAAAAHGLPLAILRVVSDGAGHSLPRAALAGMGANGEVNVLGVLGALARDPTQLPALMRLGRNSGRAFAALAKARAALGRPGLAG